jgi:hypothetical protein
MNGISGTRRRRRSKEQVKRLVAEFEASGLERREFCGRHGLALSILQRHLTSKVVDYWVDISFPKGFIKPFY